MLQEIPWWKFLEWKLYEELEPFPNERADLNAAHIVQYLWALSGDRSHPNGRPLADFQLSFGDKPKQAPVVQTIEHQERLLDAWIIGSNAVFAGKPKGAD